MPYKKIIILFIGIYYSFCSAAQVGDSVLLLIPEAKNDSIKARLYVKAIRSVVNNDNTRLLDIYQEGKTTLAKFPSIHGEALHVIAWGLVRTGNYEVADDYYAQAKAMFTDSIRLFAITADIALSHYSRLNFVKSEAILLKNIANLERQIPFPTATLTRNYYILGLIYLEQGKAKKAENIFNITKQLARKAGLKVDESVCEINMALIMLRRGLYAKSLNHAKSSVGMIENPDANNITNADYLLTFAQIYNKLKLYERGDSLLAKTKILIQKTKDSYLPIAIELEELEQYLEAGNLSKSKSSIQSIEQQLKLSHHYLLSPYFQEKVIIFDLLNKDTVAALNKIDTLLALSTKEEIEYYKAKSYLFLSDIYASSKPDEALTLSLKALNIAEALPNESLIEKSYQQLAYLNEMSGQFEQATFYHKRLSSLQDTIQLTNSAIEVLAILLDQLEKSLEGTPTHATIVDKNKPSFFSNPFFWVVNLSLVLVISILLVLKIRKNQRKKLVHDSDQAILIQNKGTLDNASSVVVEDANLKKQKAQSFQLLMDNLSSGQIDWPQFLIEYEQLYPEFIANLRNLSIKHTSNTLRHCICLRMNLSLKETAALLHVSISAVKSARNRLKKQLKLSAEESIQAFINAI